MGRTGRCSGSVTMSVNKRGEFGGSKTINCQKRSGHSIFNMHRGWLYANVVVEWTHSTRLAAQMRKKEKVS